MLCHLSFINAPFIVRLITGKNVIRVGPGIEVVLGCQIPLHQELKRKEKSSYVYLEAGKLQFFFFKAIAVFCTTTGANPVIRRGKYLLFFAVIPGCSVCSFDNHDFPHDKGIAAVQKTG